MAALTDEQKAQMILEGVEGIDPDENLEDSQELDDNDTTQPGGDDDVEEVEDEEKPENSPEDAEELPDGTFTKKFSNLKGDTWEAYGASLEEAYDSSFKESLRLFEENKQLKAENAQLRTQQPPQQPGQPQPGAPDPQQGNQPQPPVPAPNAQAPEWAVRAQERDRQDMLTAFTPFREEYPQVTEQPNFEAFRNASDGVKDTMTKALGRYPTWPELFHGIAGLLGWQPVTPQNRKNAQMKDAAAGARSANGQSRSSAPKKEKFSDAQIEAYMKMFTGITREQAIKELSEDN